MEDSVDAAEEVVDLISCEVTLDDLNVATGEILSATGGKVVHDPDNMSVGE